MKGKIFWGFTLLIISAIIIFFYNCTKKSTKYDFNQDNYLYASGIGDYAKGKIYIFSISSDSLVDSISLGPNMHPNYLSLSPDKRTLYTTVQIKDTLTGSTTFSVCEIDTRSKTIKYLGLNSSPLVTPDGKYLFGVLGEGFKIFDARNHEVVYQDTTQYYTPWCFDGKAHLAYGVCATDVESIRVFNYKTMQWVRSFSIRLRDGSIPGIGRFVISPDGNTLYLKVRAPTFVDYFCAYDLTQDSLLVQLGINTASGELGITPDGNTVYITDPGDGNGCIIFSIQPTGMLGVFDTKTNTPLPSIDLHPMVDSGTPNPNYIRITRDGEKAYLDDCADWILVIDLIRNETLKTITVSERKNLHFIAL